MNIKKLLTIEHVVHAVMIVFSIASGGNVAEFMQGGGHNDLTSYGIAIALAGGLVAVSIMLTRVDVNERKAFWAMLLSTVAVGILSGTIQMMAYLEHGSGMASAIFLGYGLPLVGECLLALATALYSASERKRRAANSDDAMEERINTALSDALADIDVSAVSSYVEQQAMQIMRVKMDQIVQRRLGTQPIDTAPQPALIEVAPTPQEAPSALNLGDMAQMDTEPLETDTAAPQTALDRMNAARMAKVVARRDEVLRILSTEFNGQSSDALDKTELGRRVGASRQTVSKDIEVLIGAKRLSVNGHIEVKQ